LEEEEITLAMELEDEVGTTKLEEEMSWAIELEDETWPILLEEDDLELPVEDVGNLVEMDEDDDGAVTVIVFVNTLTLMTLVVVIIVVSISVDLIIVVLAFVDVTVFVGMPSKHPHALLAMEASYETKKSGRFMSRRKSSCSS